MYVFAYGSLLAFGGDEPADGVPARLWGWRRFWGVAMDNRRDLPAYKHYLDDGGSRPEVYVAFLDIRRAAGGWVNGVALPVDADQLGRLDVRERNYRRLEVAVQGLSAPVWTYVGRSAARARRRRGSDSQRLVVSREYHDRVLDGFSRLGEDEVADFRASTDPLPCPLADLRVIHHERPIRTARGVR